MGILEMPAFQKCTMHVPTFKKKHALISVPAYFQKSYRWDDLRITGHRIPNNTSVRLTRSPYTDSLLPLPFFGKAFYLRFEFFNFFIQ
jgi:hypothetical protein